MLDSHYLSRCLETLDYSLQRLRTAQEGSIDYQVFRNAVIKGFELSLEVAGKLLRKALKTYTGDPKAIDQLSYKAVFRHAAKRGLVTTEQVQRWFNYRDNRNSTAHDYGEAFAEQTLILLADFISDAQALQRQLQQCFDQSDA